MRTKSLVPAFLATALLLACRDQITDPIPSAVTTTTEADASANGNKTLTVMTQNVYLGADLNPVIGAPSPQLIPIRVAQVWAAVQQTNFPERAKRLAEQIAENQPDLIGLQEVSLWRTQFPGDAHLGNPVPSTEVVYDFLQILLAELDARGQKYDVASVAQGVDVELFMFTGTPGASLTRDIRMTDRDVILAKHNVTTSNAQGGQFAAKFSLNVGGAGGPPITIPRAWTSTDVKFRGETFRFFNTHLEVDSPPFGPVQEAQANEVITMLNASPLPVIAVGDYNSAADGSTTASYGALLGSGLTDVWGLVNVGNPGYSGSGIGADLLGPIAFTTRIDLVMYRGPMVGIASWLIGEQETDRTPSGLLPSDHAGVVATIRVGVK